MVVIGNAQNTVTKAWALTKQDGTAKGPVILAFAVIIGRRATKIRFYQQPVANAA